MTRLLTPGAALLGLVLSSPALWTALDGTGSVDAALTRFLLGTLGAGVALAAVRGLVQGYASGAGRPPSPARRASDRAGGDTPQG